MKCRHCKNDIPDGSLFCMYCGEKLVRTASDKKEIRVPKPRQLPSGKWFIQLRSDGKSIPITEDTEEKAITKAKAIKGGLISDRARNADNAGKTLDALVVAYQEKYAGVLSPSTIRSYEIMRTNRFQSVMKKPYRNVTNWQRVIDGETGLAPKTIKNSWTLLARVLKEAGLDVPAVTLPALVRNERPFLTAEQIPIFLDAIEGSPAELPALLALHSLRCSEIYALTLDKIDLDRGLIHVRGAVVPDKDNHLVAKETNKNETSARDVPIMIPRLRELLEEAKRDGVIAFPSSAKVGDRIAKACTSHNLPVIRFHGLRHSFATLAVHTGMDAALCQKIGGWSDVTTMRKVYTHVSDADRLQAANNVTKFFEKIQNANAFANEQEKSE